MGKVISPAVRADLHANLGRRLANATKAKITGRWTIGLWQRDTGSEFGAAEDPPQRYSEWHLIAKSVDGRHLLRLDANNDTATRCTWDLIDNVDGRLSEGEWEYLGRGWPRKILDDAMKAIGRIGTRSACKKCDGHGLATGDYACGTCGGSGIVEAPRA